MIWKPDDDALVKKLAALLEETGLSEIEVGWFWKRLRVARHKGVIAVSEPAAPPAGPAATLAAKPAAEIGLNHPGAVTAPMVGTVGHPPYSKGDAPAAYAHSANVRPMYNAPQPGSTGQQRMTP